MIETKFKFTLELEEELFTAAELALKNSYSPYSKKKVAAAILCKSGKIYYGCNIENASYGATNCAERTALFKAVSEGERHFSAILILTQSREPWPPCGICRQALLEFFDLQSPVILASTQEKRKKTTLKKLCPDSFSKKNL